MDNVHTEGTEYQYFISTSGEALRRNFHVRRSERIRKYPQRYDPGFGVAIELKNDAVASIFSMIQYGDINSNGDKEETL